MDYVITALVLVLLAATAYWLGLQAQKREAAQRPPHRTLVVGVEGFCRLIRGWEWVALDEGGGIVGVTLRGVGGMTGMQLALVQVERELARGDQLPIRQDKVASLLRHESVSAAVPNAHFAENVRQISRGMLGIEDGVYTAAEANARLRASILDDPAGAAREGIRLGDQSAPTVAAIGDLLDTVGWPKDAREITLGD